MNSIIVDNNNTAYDSRYNCNAIIEKSSGALIAGCSRTEIPSDVTSIGNYAFDGCSLDRFTIPDSVTSVGEYAFHDCVNLNRLTMPYSIKTCETSFAGCKSVETLTLTRGTGEMNSSSSQAAPWNVFKGSLKEVILDEGVHEIGDRAFADFTGLTSITFSEGMDCISGGAFSGCTGLTSITFPDGLTVIDYSAFANCTGLTSITFPDSLTIIDYSAFANCTGLTSITFPDSLIIIGSYAFLGCTGLTSVTFPDSVGRIGMESFAGCTGLKSVILPNNSLNSIECMAFENCTGLTSITIPDGKTNIDMSTFSGCTGLTSVTLPDSVTDIGTDAFSGCTNISDVYYSGSKSDWNNISIGTGNSPLTNATIHYSYGVPHTHSYVSTITTPATCHSKGVETLVCEICDDSYTQEIEMIPHTFGEWEVTTPATMTTDGVETRYCANCSSTETRKSNRCGDNVYWTFDESTGTLTISGSGDMYEHSNQDEQPFRYSNEINTVVIEHGVESICNYAFNGCSNLTNVTIPNSVTRIGEEAFSNSGLTSITIPESVTSMDNAFGGSNSITLYCYLNSAAHIYAKENHIPYVIINSATTAPDSTVTVDYSKMQIYGFVNGAEDLN